MLLFKVIFCFIFFVTVFGTLDTVIDRSTWNNYASNHAHDGYMKFDNVQDTYTYTPFSHLSKQWEINFNHTNLYQFCIFTYPFESQSTFIIDPKRSLLYCVASDWCDNCGGTHIMAIDIKKGIIEWKSDILGEGLVAIVYSSDLNYISTIDENKGKLIILDANNYGSVVYDVTLVTDINHKSMLSWSDMVGVNNGVFVCFSEYYNTTNGSVIPDTSNPHIMSISFDNNFIENTVIFNNTYTLSSVGQSTVCNISDTQSVFITQGSYDDVSSDAKILAFMIDMETLELEMKWEYVVYYSYDSGCDVPVVCLPNKQIMACVNHEMDYTQWILLDAENGEQVKNNNNSVFNDGVYTSYYTDYGILPSINWDLGYLVFIDDKASISIYDINDKNNWQKVWHEHFSSEAFVPTVGFLFVNDYLLYCNETTLNVFHAQNGSMVNQINDLINIINLMPTKVDDKLALIMYFGDEFTYNLSLWY